MIDTTEAEKWILGLCDRKSEICTGVHLGLALAAKHPELAYGLYKALESSTEYLPGLAESVIETFLKIHPISAMEG